MMEINPKNCLMQEKDKLENTIKATAYKYAAFIQEQLIIPAVFFLSVFVA